MGNFPFTTEEFLNVFRLYNKAVFPVQLFFNLLAIVVMVLIIKKFSKSDKFISLILAFFWLWIGIVYHFVFFSVINPAAYFFSIIFILQGIIFLYYGYFSGKLSFSFRKTQTNYAGLSFILYALIIYPVLGYILGHSYPASPTFGLPCPTTIFTFGVLLFIDTKIPPAVFIIPFLWSLLGLSASISFSIYEDMGLLIAGVLGSALLLLNNKEVQKVKAAI